MFKFDLDNYTPEQLQEIFQKELRKAQADKGRELVIQKKKANLKFELEDIAKIYGVKDYDAKEDVEDIIKTFQGMVEEKPRAKTIEVKSTDDLVKEVQKFLNEIK